MQDWIHKISSFLKTSFSMASLRSSMILWFALLSLVPLAWISIISYKMSKKIIIQDEIENLQALSLCKTQAIERYFTEKNRTAVALAKDKEIIETMQYAEFIIKYGIYVNAYDFIKKNQKQLQFKTEILGYSNLFFVSLDGDVVFSAFPSDLVGINLLSNDYKTSELNHIFLTAKNFLETQFSNFTNFHPLEPPASFISTPILDDQKLKGVLIAQIKDQDIFSLITDYSGLGETGETILVTEIGNKIFVQTPLRNSKDNKNIHFIPQKTPFGEFVSKVLKGEKISSQVIDYQGEETLMAGRFLLPLLNWGIITKVNMNELLAPIDKLKLISALLALTSGILVLLVATNVAYNITHPILELTKKTKLMAEGDLSQHIAMDGQNEISNLAESFNEMAAKLNSMITKLDSLVAFRTKEVQSKNFELLNMIDELKKTQDRLITQEKLASLGSLTAGIAHEIKNPLNFINNFAELSLQIDKDLESLLEKIKDQLNEEDFSAMREFLDVLKININKIYEHGLRADNIVRNMLQHSRGSSGEVESIDLNNLLNEDIGLSFHGMRAHDPSFNVKFEKNFDPDLPKINVAVQEINRVFLNILNNAYYSVHEKKKLNQNYNPIIKVSTSFIDDTITIKIWDNGHGIHADIMTKLFTPFFTTKPSGEGTGLGLSLSYNIIVLGHQGTLTANSKLGEYAEFVITLPTK